MKRILIIVINIFILTGCSSYTELNDLSIVNTLGIDYQNNEYILTLSVIEGNKNENKIKTFSSSNKNLDEAFQNIYLTSDKRIYLSHIDLLILSNEVIDNKLDEILNNFLKNNEYRNNFQIVYMNKNDINTFFKNKIDAKYVTNLIDTNSNETSITYKKELETFIKEILVDNNSFLPTLEFNNDELVLKGYTLVKDKKVYKTLEIEESILLNLLSNKVSKTSIYGITIYENQTTIKSRNNKINFELNMTTNIDDNNKINILKEKLLDFIKTYQKNNYDILKITDLVRKNNYSYYKNNDDLLNKLEFNINIRVKKQENYINGGKDEE